MSKENEETFPKVQISCDTWISGKSYSNLWKYWKNHVEIFKCLKKYKSVEFDEIRVMNKLERRNFMDNNKIETISNLFEDKESRSVWDSEKEEYYFSVVDVMKFIERL